PSPLTPDEFVIYEKFNAAFVPTEESNVWIQAPVCADSGLLLTDDCPEIMMKTFLRRETPWESLAVPADAILEVPKQFCGIHGPGGYITNPDDDSTQLRIYSHVDRQPELTTVSLSWYASKADKDTVFQIYQATEPNTHSSAATMLAVLNYTSASFEILFEPEEYGDYYYFIQAVDKISGEVLGTSPETKAIIGDPIVTGGNTQASPRLEGARIPYGSGYAVQLVWNEINPGNEAIYQVYRSEEQDFTCDASNLLLKAGNLFTNSYTDTSVVSGHTYYYRIAGVDITLGTPITPSSLLYTTIP
ncbi:MAG: hypothetical protein LBH09_00225, partial [Peptococcaceae bacterium]|nr:hypothetical protein [Peptococcaceae bacterium]